VSVRISALAGALFFAVVLVNSNLLSGAPSATDSGRETLSLLVRHQERFQISAVLWGFGMAAAAVWLPSLLRALRRAEGGSPTVALIALGGGVLAAASTLTGAVIEGSTAARIHDLEPASAALHWTAYLMSFGATLIGLLLLIGATAVVSLQRQLFARWFGIASVMLVLVSIAGAFTIGYASTGIQTVAGIALLLDSVWIFVVSIFLWRDPGLAGS
jgi:hypothetical protein